jgi:arylsulfatase A-like enzyme
MPARREIHTGRYNFLHRSWSPLEPYDDCMPEILKSNGVTSHLISDHYHYWEDGGATYHNRYSTWDAIRGQEGDFWLADCNRQDDMPEYYTRGGQENYMVRQDWINRKHMAREQDQCQPRTMAGGMEFMRRNAGADNWFLHVETFDPHEPYFSPDRFKELYPHEYDGPMFDWPPYRKVEEPPEWVEHMRCMSAALHTMCDDYLGRILDLMDELDMWKDTMLIVNTDHGFLLGEHDFWAKCHMPFYNEVAHTPLFIWDPRVGCAGERRDSLVQTIDLPATLLEFFGIELPPHMEGLPLRETLADDTPVRAAGLFGIHGGQVNVTDGKYVYMRAPVTEDNTPLFNYTLMPTHMRGYFGADSLQSATLHPPFAFTKGMPLLRVPGGAWRNMFQYGHMLFDVENDPGQERLVDDPDVEERMCRHIVRLMKANDAPPEQYERLGLDPQMV